jgi:hypothetical protein
MGQRTSGRTRPDLRAGERAERRLGTGRSAASTTCWSGVAITAGPHWRSNTANGSSPSPWTASGQRPLRRPGRSRATARPDRPTRVTTPVCGQEARNVATGRRSASRSWYARSRSGARSTEDGCLTSLHVDPHLVRRSTPNRTGAQPDPHRPTGSRPALISSVSRVGLQSPVQRPSETRRLARPLL